MKANQNTLVESPHNKKVNKAISELAILRDSAHSLAIQFKDDRQLATFYEAQDTAYNQAIRVVMCKFGLAD